MIFVGCKLGTEALYLVPEEWREPWTRCGGHLIREATADEGTASEPTLMVLTPRPKETTPEPAAVTSPPTPSSRRGPGRPPGSRNKSSMME